MLWGTRSVDRLYVEKSFWGAERVSHLPLFTRSNSLCFANRYHHNGRYITPAFVLTYELRKRRRGRRSIICSLLRKLDYSCESNYAASNHREGGRNWRKNNKNRKLMKLNILYCEKFNKIIAYLTDKIIIDEFSCIKMYLR